MDRASFALSLFVVAFQDEIKRVNQKLGVETNTETRNLLQQQLEQAQFNHKRAVARHAQLCAPGGPLVPFREDKKWEYFRCMDHSGGGTDANVSVVVFRRRKRGGAERVQVVSVTLMNPKQ